MLRVTPSVFASQAVQSIQAHNAKLARLQQQASSGLRINAPSDDPAVIGSLLAKKTQVGRFEVNLGNLQSARTTLNLSVSQLLDAKDVLVKAKDVALQANQTDEREVLAQEVDALIERLLGIANAHDGENYVFAGTAVDTEPFRVTAETADGRPATIEYFGSSIRAVTPIGAEWVVDTRYSGAEVFQPAGDSAHDAFGTLIRLRDNLRNQSLSASELADEFAQRIGEIDAVQERVLGAVGEQSAALEHLELLDNQIRDFQLESQTAVSQLESADLSEVVLKLQEERNLLQFTLASTMSLLDVSLLAFLQ